ncbi:MAG TPA: YbaK/EbsC family protein [Chloroflexia bacterium]|nr:YbaK/EbsC family protein [Chloroflexia bacterium]
MHPRVAETLMSAGLPYRVYRHADFPDPIRTPADFAHALGYEPGRIAKSLFFRCQPSGQYCILVCPSTMRADLRQLAQYIWCRRIQFAGSEELLASLDYPPTGVSPLGAGAVPVFMDEALMAFPTVLVGAGEAGVEIEIAPADLRLITGATVLDVAGQTE